ncbi:MAG: hypothetical protein JWL70_358 [Acidimicrobiia bacterium]|nr:hypothetical protein [Acidimicrobiia bacterium]
MLGFEGFSIEGFVADGIVFARWEDGSLDASDQVLRRAAALEALDSHRLGEADGTPRSVAVPDPASLSFAALIRAFDMVTRIDVTREVAEAPGPA